MKIKFLYKIKYSFKSSLGFEVSNVVLTDQIDNDSIFSVLKMDISRRFGENPTVILVDSPQPVESFYSK